MQGFQGLQRVGPDLRAEPNIASLAMQLRADPGFQAWEETSQTMVGELIQNPHRVGAVPPHCSVVAAPMRQVPIRSWARHASAFNAFVEGAAAGRDAAPSRPRSALRRGQAPAAVSVRVDPSARGACVRRRVCRTLSAFGITWTNRAGPSLSGSNRSRSCSMVTYLRGAERSVQLCGARSRRLRRSPRRRRRAAKWCFKNAGVWPAIPTGTFRTRTRIAQPTRSFKVRICRTFPTSWLTRGAALAV